MLREAVQTLYGYRDLSVEEDELQGPIDTVFDLGPKEGLDRESLRKLIVLLLDPDSYLNLTIRSELVRYALYPKQALNFSLVLETIAYLGTGPKKAPRQMQVLITRWLVLTYFFTESGVYDKLYTALFHLVPFEYMRHSVCQLLFYTTKREHVRPYRVQMLSRFIDSSTSVVALLKLYQEHVQLVGSLPNVPLKTFKYPDTQFRRVLSSIISKEGLHEYAELEIEQLQMVEDFSHRLKRKGLLLNAEAAEIHSFGKLARSLQTLELPPDIRRLQENDFALYAAALIGDEAYVNHIWRWLDLQNDPVLSYKFSIHLGSSQTSSDWKCYTLLKPMRWSEFQEFLEEAMNGTDPVSLLFNTVCLFKNWLEIDQSILISSCISRALHVLYPWIANQLVKSKFSDELLIATAYVLRFATNVPEQVPLAPPALVYYMFFSNNVIAVGEICSYIAKVRPGTNDWHKRYVVDIVNTLVKHNPMCSFVPQEFMDTIASRIPLLETVEFRHIFSLFNLPSIASRMVGLLRLLEDADKDCTTRHAGPVTEHSIQSLVSSEDDAWLQGISTMSDLHKQMLQEMSKDPILKGISKFLCTFVRSFKEQN